MLAEVVPAVPGSPMQSITFLGVTVNLLTADGLLELVAYCIRDQTKIVVANHNLHSLCLHTSSSQDATLMRQFYANAQYTLADGMSIIALGKLHGQPISLRHRIAYNDWLPVMLPVAVKNGWRIFFLGSTADVAAKGVQVLRERFPGLQLKSHEGHFDIRHDGNSNVKVLTEISEFRPHILFVGMGMPRQERWIYENRNEIDANAILPSGATLDYIAGAKRMAPRWMGPLGVEWAFRLATEPRRLAYRYLVEPWGLVNALITSSLTPRDQMSSVEQDRAE